MTETEARPTLLLVDDSATNLQMLTTILRDQGYRLLAAKSGEKALDLVHRGAPLVVLLDIVMPGGIDGYQVCRRIKTNDATKHVCVIFLSALGESKDKVHGLSLGAADFITKPFDADEVVARVATHVQIQQLQQALAEQNARLSHELSVARDLVEDANARLDGVLSGTSRAVAVLRREVDQLAAGHDRVLITGPPGSGHEAVARALHDKSERRHRAFIYVDCAGLQPDDEPGLFGTSEEADAHNRQLGKWELAHLGTLFLDHAAALPPSMSRQLEERIARLDAERARGDVSTDVRIVGATHATDPDHDSARHQLSPALRALLATNTIQVPSLAERTEDIGTLAELFLDRKSRRMGRNVDTISRDTHRRLERYTWPGNIDELSSVIDCALLASQDNTLEVDDALLNGHGRLGQYDLSKRLGEGGMGEVWAAQHRLLARPAAVKLVKLDQLSDPKARVAAARRFEREAKVTASLESPNTVRLYDFGVSDSGDFYYVMERLQGLDLHRMVKLHGPVPVERAVHFLDGACGSMIEAHEAELVHRDIKPANLFASLQRPECDVIKVLDFGIVRVDTSAQAGLTADQVVGTPAFMAPEVALGQKVDGRADLYALGCVAFFLTSGRVVFTADTPVGVILHHAQTVPQTLSSVSEQYIPEAFEHIVARLLSKDPADRFTSARALRVALRHVPVDKPWTAERAEEWWRLNR